ncbi:MAG: DUF362 domain-containing protein [Deltaproteobacteria bacterium]|nr:DUF362 domain-containing protein [Deltaproteobacteria bacterium]
MKTKVAIVKYEKPIESVEKAIYLSGALNKLKKGDKVFIKPNIVFWSRNVAMPPWGVITTTRVVEDVLRQVIKKNPGEIIIGEGTITSDPKDKETPAHAFETLGYNELARKYGAKIINVFDKKFCPVDLGGGISLNMAEDLINADFVISLPVLKTHAQTKVSLSMKNIKGCLNMESRKLCHSADMVHDLDFHVSQLVNALPESCTIIDGIYTLERGPAYTGNAKRSNIIIASSDLLAADITGAALLGFNPEEVPHIKKCCEEADILPSTESVEIVGEPLENMVRPHKWAFPYNKDNTLPLNLERIGVKGFSFPRYDHSLCTYCSELMGPIQMTIGNAWNGKAFDDVEVLTGKIRRPTPGMRHTILLGQCQVKLNKDNKDIENRILVPGCPPKIDKLIAGLKESGIKVDPAVFENLDMAPGLFMKRYKGKSEFSQKFYRTS